MIYSTSQTETSISTLAERLKKGAVLLDVRTHSEYAGYHLPGAINIPYDEIDRMKSFLVNLKSPFITYSSHGRRSRIAAQRLKALGMYAYNAGTIYHLEAVIRKPEASELIEHA